MGLTGKRTAWNSVNGLLRRWEGLEGQTEDFRQTRGAGSDGVLTWIRPGITLLRENKTHQHSAFYHHHLTLKRKCYCACVWCVCECRGHLSGGSPLLPLSDSDWTWGVRLRQLLPTEPSRHGSYLLHMYLISFTCYPKRREGG